MKKRELQMALGNSLRIQEELRKRTAINLGPVKTGVYRILVNGQEQGDPAHLLVGDTFDVNWRHTGTRPSSVTIEFEPERPKTVDEQLADLAAEYEAKVAALRESLGVEGLVDVRPHKPVDGLSE